MEASNIQQPNPSEDNNKMDTVTMARHEREKHGPCEAEISYGGEVDLHKHFIICDKNPGHLKFVPVDELCVGHLPSGCQDNLLVEMIRAVSDITVRVSVKYVSESRPETFPGSGIPYPCCKNRGSDMMRAGTGWVTGVTIYPDKDNNITICGCKECRNSPTPKTQFAHIDISTATHVVCDHLEAADTTCHLFFDRGSKHWECEGVIALSGMSWLVNRISGDWCVLVHMTHDLDLAQRLHKMLSLRDNLIYKVGARYDHRGYPPLRYNRQETGSEPDSLLKLTIIVSHPHGCSKKFSVGYYTDCIEIGKNNRQYTYTTATCPGSSGAPVYILGEDMGFLNPDRVHSGNCVGNKDLNCSSWALHSE